MPVSHSIAYVTCIIYGKSIFQKVHHCNIDHWWKSSPRLIRSWIVDFTIMLRIEYSIPPFWDRIRDLMLCRKCITYRITTQWFKISKISGHVKEKRKFIHYTISLGWNQFHNEKKKVNSNVFKFEFELQIHFNHIFLDIQNFSMT